MILRNLEFEDDQKAHQQSQLKILRSAHHDIADIMTRIHKTFATDGPEVCAVFDLFSGSIPSEMCLHLEKVVIWHIYKIVILDLLCGRAAQFNDKSQLAISKSEEAAIFQMKVKCVNKCQTCHDFTEIVTQKLLFTLIFHHIMLTI